MTAMALDPIYISMANVPDFAGLGGELALDGAEQAEIERLRQVAAHRLRVDPAAQGHDGCGARSIVSSGSKSSRGSPRARASTHLSPREAWWLDDYALFRSLHAMHEERAVDRLARAAGARRAPARLRDARGSLALEITYRTYLQWIAAEQWAEAKRLSWPVRVFGDLPFMISADSPDVWARQHEFRFDATIGVPPDAFSETGQDWGLPPWRADVMAANGFTWMRARARRYGDLYDGFRIDHLVGLYRTYVRPIDKSRAGVLRSRRGSRRRSRSAKR